MSDFDKRLLQLLKQRGHRVQPRLDEESGWCVWDHGGIVASELRPGVWEVFRRNGDGEGSVVGEAKSPGEAYDLLEEDTAHDPRLQHFWARQEDSPEGLSLPDLAELSFDEMENNHDWVQWAFPLPERSGARPQAPVASPALLRMLRKEEYDSLVEGVVGRFELFLMSSEDWRHTGNHNLLRITRMLRFLTLTGRFNRAYLFRQEMNSWGQYMFFKDPEGWVTPHFYWALALSPSLWDKFHQALGSR